MILRLTLVYFCSFIYLFSYSQNILTVGGHPDNGSTNYTSIQAAINAATSGDIIQVFSGDYNEGTIRIDKPIYLQGVGYFIDHNYNNYNISSGNSYISSTLQLEDGAANSIIEGMDIRSLNIFGVDNIQILRSRIQRGDFRATQSTFSGCQMSGYYHSGVARQYLVNNNVNIVFNNCLFSDSYSAGTRNFIFGPASGMTSNGVIDFNRCIFRNSLHLNLSALLVTVKNSIFLTSKGGIFATNASGSIIINSLFESSSSSDASIQNNIFSITPTNEFSGYPNSIPSFDAQYQLKETSQAKGYATDGGDCGIFGGDDPYILSGIPSIPFIYDFDANLQGSTGGGLDVNIKVKSQN